MRINEYISNLINVIGCKLIDPSSLYYGKDGHERFAREVGYALYEFPQKEIDNFMKYSYGMIYVKYCDLCPIFDSKEWNYYLNQGVNKARIAESRRMTMCRSNKISNNFWNV